MKNNFELRKFLTENRLTSNNNTLKENTASFSDIDEALDSLIAEDSKTMGMRDLAPHYIAAAKEVGFSDEQTKKAFGLVKRFMDKRAKGRRVKFINYGWAGYEDLYRNLLDRLNKADGGGWEIKNDGSWYGDGSGWQVVKTYPFDSVSEKEGDSTVNEKKEIKMKNNFDLRKFLTENKLTSNSKLLKEDFAPSPNSDLMDANAEEYDIATAFKKAKVDMSKPVTILHAYGSAAFGGDDSKEMSAEAAIKMLEAERQERRKTYTDDGKEVPSDWHSYEFENSSVLEEDMPEGHEYKFAYFQTGDADYAITQEKSGVSEKAPGYMHDCAAKVMHEKYGKGDCIPEEHTLVKEGNKYVVTHYDVLFESGKTVKNIPVEELKIITESHHGHKRRKK